MFGFRKSRSRNSAALVAQQQKRDEPPEPEMASFERIDAKDHRDFSVLESVDGEGTVLIGKGTTVVGEIGNCSKVEVQGHLEGSLVAGSVVIREGGSIKGGLHAGHADVRGIVDGDVLVEELLNVRSTGRVMGEVAYGKLAVEVGGDIAGAIRGPTTAQTGAEQQDPSVNGHETYSPLEGPGDKPLMSTPPPLNRH